MPTYQYACTACDHRFDAVQAFSDASLTECPECDGKLRKLYGSVGVVFKGSGFYRNDSRSDKSSDKKPATADASASSSDSSSDSSSEKPAAKSDKSTDKSSTKTASTSSTSSSSSEKVAS